VTLKFKYPSFYFNIRPRYKTHNLPTETLTVAFFYNEF